MNKKSLLVFTYTIAVWFIFSLMASMFKVSPTVGNLCGKTYPIDYVLYTSLFCEIKKD